MNTTDLDENEPDEFLGEALTEFNVNNRRGTNESISIFEQFVNFFNS